MGMSLKMSCSCKLIVCVETTAFRFCCFAQRIAGMRYASDFPTPVPASTTRCFRSASASATATAISCCSGRYSKLFASDSDRPGKKSSGWSLQNQAVRRCRVKSWVTRILCGCDALVAGLVARAVWDVSALRRGCRRNMLRRGVAATGGTGGPPVVPGGSPGTSSRSEPLRQCNDARKVPGCAARRGASGGPPDATGGPPVPPEAGSLETFSRSEPVHQCERASETRGCVARRGARPLGQHPRLPGAKC